MGRKAITADSERGKDILTSSTPRAARCIKYLVDRGVYLINKAEETKVYQPLPQEIVDAAKWNLTQILGKPKQAMEVSQKIELGISPELLALETRRLDQWESQVIEGNYTDITPLMIEESEST